MGQNRTEENKRRYKSLQIEAESKVMKDKAEQVLIELQNCQNWMHGLEKGLRTYSNEVECGRCMRGRDGKLCFV